MDVRWKKWSDKEAQMLREKEHENLWLTCYAMHGGQTLVFITVGSFELLTMKNSLQFF